MNYFQIKANQKRYGVAKVQRMIDSGEAFTFSGEFYELIWSMIYSGACMLPNVVYRDLNTGKEVAVRQMVRSGPGSFKHCSKYWEKFVGGFNDIE